MDEDNIEIIDDVTTPEPVVIAPEPASAPVVESQEPQEPEEGQYSKKVQERINSLTKKAGNTERENIRLLNELSEMKGMIVDLSTNQAKVANDNRVKELNELRRQAIDNGDYESELKYNTDILNILKSQPAPKTEVKTTQHPVQPQQSGSYTPEVVAFMARNEWFQEDVAMTNTALQYNNQLFADPEWSRKGERAILNEVEKRIKRDFAHKFPEYTPPPSAVEGISQPASKTAKIQIKQSEINEFRSKYRISAPDETIKKYIVQQKLEAKKNG